MKSLKQFLTESIISEARLKSEAANELLEKAVPGFLNMYAQKTGWVVEEFEKELRKIGVKNFAFGFDNDYGYGPSLLEIDEYPNDTNLTKDQLDELSKPAKGYTVNSKRGSECSAILDYGNEGYRWFYPFIGGKNAAKCMNTFNLASAKECAAGFNAWATAVDAACGTSLSKTTSSPEFEKAVCMVYTRCAAVTKGRAPRDLCAFLSK